MEKIIAGIIVVVAFAWVIRSICRAACGKEAGCHSSCGGSCCGGGCGKPDDESGKIGEKDQETP